MRKTAPLVIGLLVITILVGGCSNHIESTNPIANSSKPNEDKNEGTVQVKVRVRNYTELSSQDFEKANEFSRSFLSDYYHSLKTGSPKIDFTKYIVNENLLKYSTARLLEDRELDLHKLTIELDSSKLIEDKKSYYFSYAIIVNHGSSEFGEGVEILVSRVNGNLVISDWYVPQRKVGFDAKYRPNAIMNNPDVWDDQEYVNRILDKAGLK
jgi:hypothetical protein